MLNVNERASGRQAVITQWIVRAINLHGVRIEVRFRGNLLHILCEGLQAPDSIVVMSRVVEALAQADLAALLPPDPHPIYQIFLYGRGFGSDRPSWSEPIYLNQLDRHLEQLKHLQPPPPDLSSFSLHQPPTRSHAGSTVAAVKTSPPASRKSTRLPSTPAVARSKAPVTPALAGSTPARATTTASAALLVPNRTLAKQGKPEAIARYLSETLGAMGVAVEVTAKSLPCTPDATTDSQHRNRRLWIICEAPYSPDPATLAEPIAQKLRDLELELFRDALVFSQVSGEPRPDWRLQVDLTPPDEMLKEWARWGDVQAIARLLNQPLAADKVRVEAELKESTLHLVCSVTANSTSSTSSAVAPTSEAPSQATVVTTVSALLEALAPQGIQAATLYGQVAGQEAPAWVDWLNLPAAQHSALAESAMALAQQGDRPALQFLLSRLLNPNLDWRLATGGVRIQILDRGDLLHIMSDAPVCPKQKQVGPTVAKFLRQLKISNVAGIRVYGRRAGQKRPLWSYGADFSTRDRLVPEATPEFAASDAYVNELLTQPNEIPLRPELTSEAFQAALSETTQRLTQRLQQILLRSQLFLPSDQPTGQQIGYKGAAVALVWGTLGLLLTLQTDWVLGQILQVKTDLASVDAQPKTRAAQGSTKGSVAVNATSKPRPPLAVPKPPASLKKSQGDDKTAFNASGFTESIPPVEALADEMGAAPKPLPAEPLKATATSIAVLAAARSPYATFNSRQLDEKLALYYQRLAESGPPDILIIGSSRALRGVDPAALQKALAAQGYPGLSVFNFGVNGATAQVVDVILRQVLTPDQMPKLIVWADGARAFNSGRVDITYNAIAVSKGYRQVLAGTVPNTPNTAASPAATTVATNNLGAATPAGTPSDGNQAVGTSLAASYQALNQWMNASLGTFSVTYAQRDQLKQLLQQQWAGVLKPKPSLEQLLATQGQFGASSASPSGEGAESDSLLYAIDFDGFLPLSLRFNPATYYQKYAKVTGDYDSDYESFALKGKQMKALESLVQFTQAKQVPLVFVNLPLTKDYLDPIRMEHEEEFRRQMVQLATENGFVFRDLSQLWPAENDYFSDPSHLNRYGAYEVSNRLAQDPLIPWPRSQTSASTTP